MAFLHGAEIIEIQDGPVSVRVVRSGVIALVGIAPIGAAETLTRVSSKTEAAQFGKQVPGFTIPQALEAIFAQNAGTVLVANVFDEASHTAAVTEEELTSTLAPFRTAFAPVGTTFTLTDNAGTTTYVKDTDYEVNEFGDIKVLDFTEIPVGTAVKATYKKLDTSLVTSSDIIGAFDSGTQTRTGMQLFDEAFGKFGFSAKLIIAPDFCETSAVVAEMQVKADKYKAIAIIDAPEATTVADAITGRGPSGSINFNVSSKRVLLCYPQVKAYDPYSDAQINKGMSQYVAGVIANTDATLGYHVSPSNKVINGVTGPEFTITADYSDANSEVNQLNEQGISTIFNGFGTGIRFWGNRSSAFPASTEVDNFIPVRRTADIIHDSILQSMLPFIDRPINTAVIDSIRETVNQFLTSLIQRGAIIGGACTFDTTKNTPASLASGKLIFDLTILPPPPLERLTFESFIDINQLQAVLN